MPEEHFINDGDPETAGEQDSAATADRTSKTGASLSKPAGTPLWVLGSRVLALFFVGTALYATCAFPKLVETSDYLSAFYVAGKAVLSGHSQSLYPTARDLDFHSLAFNQLAHQVLPNLSADKTAIYMYSPANALLFAPFALLSPVPSMLAWQILSLLSAVCSIIFVCRLRGVTPSSLRRQTKNVSTETEAATVDRNRSFANSDDTEEAPVVQGSNPSHSPRMDDAFFGVCLFLPVIHTLLIGQLGLLAGLLPCSAAIWCLLRRRDLLAGVCFSTLLLKPHFMPVAMLVAGALALNRRWACTAGLLGGCLAIVGLSSLILAPDIWLSFARSFSMTDTFFSNPSYGVPLHLVACIPGAVMQAVGPHDRQVVKVITYSVAALCGLHALIVCSYLFRRETFERALLLTAMMGILTLPIVIPHLLFYDLCLYSLVGLLIFILPWPKDDKFVLCVWAGGSWLLVDVYYVLAVSGVVRAPLLMVAVLLALLVSLYVRLIKFALRD